MLLEPLTSFFLLLLCYDAKWFQLSRFIQTYGTHVIVGMAVGGQDLICVKQRASSLIPSAELKGYLDELGDSLFSDANSPMLERKAMNKQKKVCTYARYICIFVCVLVSAPLSSHVQV